MRKHRARRLLLLQAPAPPTVAFDEQGLVFCVGAEGVLRLYDARQYDQGPFAAFPVGQPPRGRALMPRLIVCLID